MVVAAAGDPADGTKRIDMPHPSIQTYTETKKQSFLILVIRRPPSLGMLEYPCVSHISYLIVTYSLSHISFLILSYLVSYRGELEGDTVVSTNKL